MEIWVDLANIVGSLATVGALLAVIYEVKKSRDAESRKAAFDVMNDWQNISEELSLVWQTSWENSEDLVQKYPVGSKEFTAYVKVANYFEMIGESVIHGLLDRDMAFLQLGRLATDFWKRMRFFTIALREKADNEDASLYFEWFALQSENTTPKASARIKTETALLREKTELS